MRAPAGLFRALKGHDFSRAADRAKSRQPLVAAERGLPKEALAALKGHDFSRAAKSTKIHSASAAEGSGAQHGKSILPAKSNERNPCRHAAWSVLLLPLLMAASCRSYIVHVTVMNHTGGVVNQLEVDYPSASFGVDSLPAGAVYQYRLQLQDSGPIKVSYTEGEKQQYKSTGPRLHEKQQGDLEIVLDPSGKTEFHLHLNPPS